MTRNWRLPESESLVVSRWHDSVVAARGRPMDDPYVEEHWLPVLGPSATWLARRLVRRLGEEESATVELRPLAGALGMAHEPGRDGPFARAFGRLVMFGFAQPSPVRTDHLFVRTLAPDVPGRHLERLRSPVPRP